MSLSKVLLQQFSVCHIFLVRSLSCSQILENCVSLEYVSLEYVSLECGAFRDTSCRKLRQFVLLDVIVTAVFHWQGHPIVGQQASARQNKFVTKRDQPGPLL
jgi:hypothetical protein